MIHRPSLIYTNFPSLYCFQADVREYFGTMFSFYLRHQNKMPPFFPKHVSLSLTQ